MPTPKKTPVAEAVSTAAKSDAPKTIQYAAAPKDFVDQIVAFLEVQDFKKVEHLMIPIRMGVFKPVAMVASPKQDEK